MTLYHWQVSNIDDRFTKWFSDFGCGDVSVSFFVSGRWFKTMKESVKHMPHHATMGSYHHDGDRAIIHHYIMWIEWGIEPEPFRLLRLLIKRNTLTNSLSMLELIFWVSAPRCNRCALMHQSFKNAMAATNAISMPAIVAASLRVWRPGLVSGESLRFKKRVGYLVGGFNIWIVYG